MSEIDLKIDDLSVFEIMQRFRTDGSCEHMVRDALIRLAKSGTNMKRECPSCGDVELSLYCLHCQQEFEQ